MKNIDVFNGDADGICALIQYRLAKPADSELVTGVKRNIKLLESVSAKQGDNITVFDLSMEKNNDALNQVLSKGASVFYVDHHMSGNIPDHPNLHSIINTSANTCTSLLVDEYLNGKFREWAIVAAFGDNITQSALKKAKTLSINNDKIEQLKQLGICINYNGYGNSLDDLHFKPDELYKHLLAYRSPFDFINDKSSVYDKLKAGYDDDIAKTKQLQPMTSSQSTTIYKLPDKIWARRVSGVFGNQLANQYPNRAHAILSHHPKGGYVISVRAPLNNLNHADDLCKKFPNGGGRKGAAGINQITENELDKFITLFNKTYS